jgi:signal-transduction protein with cAMP-binding, CBS, and nucleotidyltransferase domain
MTVVTESDLLRQQPFAKAFTPAQVEQLAAMARVARFEPNEIIFEEFEDCSEFYLIVSGRVALEIAPHMEPLRVETLSAGDEFGWSSLLEGKGKLFRARALMLVFDGHELRAMSERDPSFGYHLMQRLLHVVSERLQSTRLQVLDMYWPAAKRAGT